MQKYLIAVLFVLVSGALFSQKFVSATLLGSKTKAQLSTQFFGLAFPYNVKYYRVLYTMPDLKGVTDTVSGLLVIPVDVTKSFPRLVYQHGTASAQLAVPSYTTTGGGEGTLGFLFAGLGYVSYLPDFLGLGISTGVHPYVHAKTEASAAIEMLRAAKDFLGQNQVSTNDQLFITGYSQGGHAAMALHREIETLLPQEFTVTAAAPLSGPYSISGVMRNVMLSDGIYLYPAYLPNTAVSFQAVYGNIYSDLTDIFKPVYAAEIQKFVDKTMNLGQLNTKLISLLTTNEGASRPTRLFQPALLEALKNDPKHPINAALRDNDVYDWTPKAPTRLFYCMADDQVPFQNSIVARDAIKANGALNFDASDVNPTADHGACFQPAILGTISFFTSFQQVTVATHAPILEEALSCYPNPATNSVTLRNLPAGTRITVMDASGTVRYTATAKGGDQRFDVGHLARGNYIVRCTGSDRIWTGKVVLL